MNKKILSMAVAGVLAAPAAALAGGPTLYGQAHMSLDYIGNVEGLNKDNSGLDATSNSSRIGVKGSFDLGGGLSAIYLLEWGVNGLYSKGGLSDRNQIAGFKSDAFGTLVMGRHDTPTKVVGRKADLFWSTQMGQNRQLVSQPV
jgi:predicted porin